MEQGRERKKRRKKKKKKKKEKEDKVKIRYGILYVWIFDMNPKVLDEDLFLL